MSTQERTLQGLKYAISQLESAITRLNDGDYANALDDVCLVEEIIERAAINIEAMIVDE